MAQLRTGSPFLYISLLSFIRNLFSESETVVYYVMCLTIPILDGTGDGGEPRGPPAELYGQRNLGVNHGSVLRKVMMVLGVTMQF